MLLDPWTLYSLRFRLLCQVVGDVVLERSRLCVVCRVQTHEGRELTLLVYLWFRIWFSEVRRNCGMITATDSPRPGGYFFLNAQRSHSHAIYTSSFVHGVHLDTVHNRMHLYPTWMITPYFPCVRRLIDVELF